MSPPTSLRLLGYGLLAFSPLYLIALVLRSGFIDPDHATLSFAHIIAVPLILAPLVIGVGVLRGKRWAWWGFLCFALVLILREAVGLILEPGPLRVSGLVLLAMGLAAIIYYLRRDISAPYFKMYPRGWRLQIRRPVKIPVQIGDRSLTTTDLSAAGLYALFEDPDFELNDALPARFQIGNETFELTVGVARIDEDGVGFAFRRLKARERKRLNAGIREFQERSGD